MSNTKCTGRDFIDFWDWATKKGELKQSTARAMKFSCLEVLKSNVDWEILDVRNIDTEDMFRRFLNKRGQDFKPASLQSYKARFKRGLEMFLTYLEDPLSWRPLMKRRPKNQKDSVPIVQKKKVQPVENVQVPTEEAALEQASHPLFFSSSSVSFMEYPFPLRSDCCAHLKLPIDIKANEVKRLADFLQTLIIDGELQAR